MYINILVLGGVEYGAPMRARIMVSSTCWRLTVQLTSADELVAAGPTVINELRSSAASSSEWETRKRRWRPHKHVFACILFAARETSAEGIFPSLSPPLQLLG